MERVQYIAARRARFNAICGPVNIPYGTTVEAVDGFLERDGLRLCAATSETGGWITRIFGCGPMTFSRPPWRTCGILPG